MSVGRELVWGMCLQQSERKDIDSVRYRSDRKRTAGFGFSISRVSAAFWVLMALFSLAASAQVTVTSPVANSTVGSPIKVAATAKSSSPITTMRVYLDNVRVASSIGAQLNTSIAAAAGAHLLVVQAWDSTGAVFKTGLNITVSASAPAPSPTPTPNASPTPTPTPTPVASPTPSIVFNEVQQWTGWLTCGSCGNTGGTGKVATYSMVRGIGFPTLSGSSAEFIIGGNFPYANAYWYYRHTALGKALKSLRYEFDLYIPSGMQNAPQAIEFECQQRLGGYTYNFAWQADYPAGQWRVFNIAAHRWENSGIPLQRFAPGTWHHIVAEYHNNSTTHTVYHDALTIDGVRHALSITHAAPFTSGTRELTNAFQLDLNGVPTPFKVFVDNMKITIID